MSKFLRQMTALSKKPSDFRPPGESAPHLVPLPDTKTVPPTDSTPHTDLADNDTPLPRIRRPHPRRARLAQDGHSHAEQAVYATLWDAGTSDSDGNRKVTMGLGRLSKGARLSENNCRLNIRSLVKKLAVEEIGAEDSRAGIGKTYRVYSYTAILLRRRAAGMEWVIRTKGVIFVDRTGQPLSIPHVVPIPGTDSTLGTETEPGSKPIPSPPSESAGESPTDSIPPFRKPFRNNDKETSSSENAVPLLECLATLGIHLDDDAGRRIVSRCQNTDRTATIEEIRFFAELKVRQLAKRRNIENWAGLLMAAIPAYFDPPATELMRYREGKRLEHENEEKIARQVLEDKQSTEEERIWAASVIERL